MIASLEVFRFAAALLVALSHIVGAFAPGAPILADAAAPGALPGVPGIVFFFTLSGLVMGVSHGGDFGRPGAAVAFWWRRARRIFPLYWAVLAFVLIRYRHSGLVTAAHLPGWIMLAPMPVPGPLCPFEMLPVAWTLRLEVAFYVLFGLMLLPRLRWPVLGVWGALVLARLPVTETGLVWWIDGFDRDMSIEFLCGLGGGLALRHLRGRVRARAAAGTAVAAAIVLIARFHANADGFEYGGALAHVVYGVGFACLMLGCALLESGPAPAWTRVAGVLSYPLYLSHAPVAEILIPALAPAALAARFGAWPVVALIVAACLGVAALLAYAVDRPIQRWLRPTRPTNPAADGPVPPRSAAARAAP